MKRSILSLYLGRLVSAGSTVLLLAVVGRLEGAAGLGIIGVGMSAGALLAALTEQGASMLVVRAIALQPDRTRQIVGGLTLMRLVLVPAGLLLLFGGLASLFPDEAAAIALAAAWLTVQQSTELTRAVLVWGGRAGTSGLHTALENIAWLGVIVGLLLGGWSLEGAFAGGLLVLVCSLLVGFLLVRARLGWWPAVPSAGDLRLVLRDSPPFTAFVVLGQLYSRVDTLLVSLLLPGGLVAAGAYFSTMRLIAGLEYLPDAVARAIYPDLARAYAAGARTVGAILRRPTELLLWASVPVPFAAFLAADWGLPVLFGSEVAGYGWVLVGVSLLVPVRFLGYLLGIALTSGGSQSKRVLATGLAAAIVVGLDVALLPQIGLVAAVIAVATAWLAAFLLYVALAWRHFEVVLLLRAARAPLASALVVFLAGLALRSSVPSEVAAPAALALFGSGYAAAWLLGHRVSSAS